MNVTELGDCVAEAFEKQGHIVFKRKNHCDFSKSKAEHGCRVSGGVQRLRVVKETTNFGGYGT